MLHTKSKVDSIEEQSSLNILPVLRPPGLLGVDSWAFCSSLCSEQVYPQIFLLITIKGALPWCAVMPCCVCWLLVEAVCVLAQDALHKNES